MARNRNKRARNLAIAAGAALGSGIALGAGTLGLVAGYAAIRMLQSTPRRANVRGRVVVVTGGSRGLGLAMAREFARRGSKVAICARNEERLRAAESFLKKFSSDIFAAPCDVSDAPSVARFMDSVRTRFGPIYILVNNAGQILVAPVENTTVEDFRRAMDVMFWGVVHPTLAVLPDMQRRRSGHIAAITSIGGKVAVPHLLPYSCAKFAAVGFCEGLRAEVGRSGIEVTTVVPGLMRTGSYLGAEFRGKRAWESAWFSLGASLPLISIDADRAARQVVSAIVNGRTERFITPQASLLARLHGAFPEVVTGTLALINRLLPSPDRSEMETEYGRDLEPTHGTLYRAATTLGRRAARKLNQPEVP